MSDNAKYRVAVVGCGRMAGTIDDELKARGGRNFPYCHAGAYSILDRTTIVAAADPVAAKREAFCKRWDVPNDYEDYRLMIEKERPDIVSICTRQPLHAEITIFSAQHGVKGIYCEKAMCSSMTEADAMVAALEENGTSFNLGVQRRFSGQYMTARQLIAEGQLGKIQWITFTGSTLLMEAYSHALDTLCYLIGDPAARWIAGEIKPNTSRTDPPEEVVYDPTTNRWEVDPHGCWATVAFEDGITAQVTNPAGIAIFELQVIGTEGILHLVDGGDSVWRKGNGYERTKAAFPEFPQRSATVGLVADLIHGMDTGEPTRSNANVSRAVTELILSWTESHTRGGIAVPMPLRNRTLFINRP